MDVRSALPRLALVGALALSALPAHAQELRYSTTAPGGIVAIGNTLGLSKATSSNGPGINGSIGTFIAVDTSSVDDTPAATGTPWGAGTTSDWTANGSTAQLTLPPRAEVLYAELVWGGSFQYGGEDVSSHLDDAITLAYGSATTSVTPDAATAQTISATGGTGFAIRYYVRSADVTSFVTSHGAGTYAARGVPGTQAESVNTLNSAGWTLVIAYRADDEQIRNLSVFVGGSFVDEDATQDYEPSGFCAPPFGPVEGKVVISALEGDADLSGDGLAIAASSGGSFVSLSGPNNPQSNIFGSQINDRDGLLVTSGSFGTVNHDPFAATNVSGGRQGWDITSIALSDDEGHLQNDQTSAVLRTQTQGDSYLPTLLAFEIDVKAPDFTDSTTSVAPTTVELGGQITLRATLMNSGEAPAANLRFKMDIDAGLTLSSYETDGDSGDADGAAVTDSRLEAGVPAGELDVDEVRTVDLVFDVIDYPENGTGYAFAPAWEHRFVTCDGEPAISDIHRPAVATVVFAAPPVDTGDTGDTGPIGDLGEGKCGCNGEGCSIPGTAVPSWPAPGLALLALFWRNRRK